MVAVMKTALIHPDSINTHLQLLLYEMVKRPVSAIGKVDGHYGEWPIHRFIAIEQMAFQDELQDVFILISMVDIYCWR
jgi:hypothetical protein